MIVINLNHNWEQAKGETKWLQLGRTHVTVPKKYTATFYLSTMIIFQIRGMSIDEAVKQLSFVERKGAEHVKEVSW